MPLYQQVAGEIKERIEREELGPGSAVPSEADLVTEYGVSRITARKAIKFLREQGLIYTVRGEGSYVGPEDAPRRPRKERLYVDIAAEIIERIKAGELHPDLPIPSETTLIQQYDVSKGTVRQVAAHLRELGWAYTVPHRGTYVKKREDWPKS